jgi:hypothetical protein
MRSLALILFALPACGKKGSGDTGDIPDTSVFDNIINVDTAPIAADLKCWTNGQPMISVSPDESCVADVPVDGTVVDFESEDPVTDAKVELFLGDEITPTADKEATSDGSGKVTFDSAPTCTPISYRVSTDPDLEETKVTIQAHEVFSFGEVINAEFDSVSYATFNIIPSLLGVSVEPGKGIVAGGAYDCNGDPIEGVQAIARSIDDPSGYFEDQVVKYFVKSFPNRNQLYTSEDGLWVIVNVPPSDAVVELWVTDGAGGHYMIGTTKLLVEADSINISSGYYGYTEQFYPDGCLSPCESAEDTGTE